MRALRSGPLGVERLFRVNGAFASRMEPGQRWQRLALDLLLLAGFGLIMSALGPYRTLDVPDLLRTAYWLVAVIGAGLAGILVDSTLGPRIRGFWLRIAGVSLVATLPVAPVIYVLNAAMLDLPRRPWLIPTNAPPLPSSRWRMPL
jgi:hypothetical protein